MILLLKIPKRHVLLKGHKSYFYIAVLFIVAYALLCVFYYSQTRNYAILEAEKKIQNYLLVHKAIHGYIEEVQKPVIYKLKAEGKLYDDFFAPEVLSFTFIARNIKDYYNKERAKIDSEPYYFKLASDNPRNLINKADDFELKLLNEMNINGLKEYKTILEEDDSKFLYYAIPVNPNKESCTLCHSEPETSPKEMLDRYGDKAGFHEKTGKIRAMISIKAPLSEEMKDADSVFFIICGVTLAVLLTIYSIIVFFVSRLHKKDSMINERNDELELFNQHLEALVLKETEKRMSQQNVLIQQSKMAAVGEMTAAIAHQWKQPLNTLGLILDYLGEEYQEKFKDDSEMKKMLGNAEDQIQFMSQTVNDFRNFFKPDKKRETFNVFETVREVEKLINCQLKQYNIIVTHDADSDVSAVVTGTKNELMQVLLNIFNNARDAIAENRGDSHEEGKIFCSVNKYDGNTMISVSDNGGGIPADKLPSIFDAYFTTKSDESGTGLGLYMSKVIISESFRGTITAENIDGGACIKIIIPSE